MDTLDSLYWSPGDSPMSDLSDLDGSWSTDSGASQHSNLESHSRIPGQNPDSFLRGLSGDLGPPDLTGFGIDARGMQGVLDSLQEQMAMFTTRFPQSCVQSGQNLDPPSLLHHPDHQPLQQPPHSAQYHTLMPSTGDSCQTYASSPPQCLPVSQADLTRSDDVTSIDDDSFDYDLDDGTDSLTESSSVSAFESSDHSHKGKRSRHPHRKVYQRTAANQRERRRMRTINDAFEGLRTRIPLACGDRKLSKVDTLRLAIRYIQQLGEMVSSCGVPAGNPGYKGEQESAKIIIRYHNQGFPEFADAATYDSIQAQYPLYGHSLSWGGATPALAPHEHKLCAKVWTPDVATSQDLNDMTPSNGHYTECGS